MCCTMMLRKVFATCVCASPCCMSPYKNLFSTPYPRQGICPGGILVAKDPAHACMYVMAIPY